MIDDRSVNYKITREISSLLKVEESAISYHRSPSFNSFQEFLSDKLHIISLINTGIPYSLFKTIKSLMPFSDLEWSEFLGVSSKTLQRYEQADTVLKSIHSEKVIELAEVTTAGLDFFRDEFKFRLWLDTPSYALANQKPLDLLFNSYGKDLVLAELTKMEHGIFV